MPRRSVPTRRSPAPPRAPHARKALGQHFLVDADALQRIAEAAEVRSGEAVLEVGSGTGELTAVLAAEGHQVVAVELDEALCRGLRFRFSGNERVHVVNANILDYSPRDLLVEAGAGPEYVVAANIPYYITAPILRHFLEASPAPRRLVLTVQREVAEALAAKPGALSLLAVSVQYYARVTLLFRLSPSAFRPPPKVESAVVSIDVEPVPRVQVREAALFFDVVRAGFRAPRKQLHNALGQGLWLPQGEAPRLLAAAGIDPMRRAQTLTLDEWAGLADAYLERRHGWEISRAGGSGPELDAPRGD
jgi:16S rRNA (adenine1518-N6/adenine1519-N6)-dimethyltransferase